MKKLIIITLTLLTAISCVQREYEPSFIRVKFGYSDYEEGKITRVTVDNTKEIKDMISKTIPSEFPLDLCYERTGMHFDTGIGEEISIPVGKYTIKGQNMVDRAIMLGDDSGISSTPTMNVLESMDINSSKSEYSLMAHFKCFAIVVSFKEVDRVCVEGKDIPFMRDGDYGIVYVDNMKSNFKIDVYPKDLTFNVAKSFTFSSKNINGLVFCQNGYYYLVHPNAVETSGLSFRLDYDEMNGVDVK